VIRSPATMPRGVMRWRGAPFGVIPRG